MPLQSTSGAASYDAFGGGTVAKVNYIEDFFQSYLRTGTGASASVTTGLDGSTKETLVWTKSRSAATNHKLTDNVRGATKALSSNTTSAEATDSQGLTAFSATGYTLGTNTDYNNSGATYVDWQWVSQPKFFDVVTYTGDGTDNRAIPHNLGSTPGCIIVKSTSGGYPWAVKHRSLSSASQYLVLNDTAAQTTTFNPWSTNPTSSVFYVNGSASSLSNGDGATYVAYLFAHDAGGFGAAGTDNVISCGSYVGNSSATGVLQNLGWEPQWVLIKSSTDGSQDWTIFDNMRGVTTGVGAVDARLHPNKSDAENNSFDYVQFDATGFTPMRSQTLTNSSSNTYIYIAIRRGPMKVPTSGTSVFGMSARSGTGANATVTGSAGVSDAVLIKNRGSAVASLFSSRLSGTNYLATSSTSSFSPAGSTILQDNPWDVMNGVKVGTTSTITNASGNTYINYLFNRAPTFMDIICYRGTGANTTQSHNLGVVPELVIVRARDNTNNWQVYNAAGGVGNNLLLNTTQAYQGGSPVSTLTSTSVRFAYDADYLFDCSGSGVNYVSYLFATCAGVSKVGSYTGTGTTKQIDCGFTGGARFVLIKRTDDTGDWYVWDSARGIVSGNDPYLLLNSTVAEVTSTDYIDTYSAGFEISSTAPAAINASGGTFIFLAIA